MNTVQIVPAAKLTARILATRGIDGVTFSGGEPFAQAGPLADIAESVRRAGLSVITYSGYTYRELTSRYSRAWDRLLSSTDLLIAGPYREGESCTAPFIGSANQQVIPLTDRVVMAPGPILEGGDLVEFTIEADGTVTTTGFPHGGMVRRIATRCRGE